MDASAIKCAPFPVPVMELYWVRQAPFDLSPVLTKPYSSCRGCVGETLKRNVRRGPLLFSRVGGEIHDVEGSYPAHENE